MKSLFDQVSFDCSRNVTKSYSTSFSSAVKMLAPNIRQDIYNIYGFVRFADEIVDSFHNYNKEELLLLFENDLEARNKSFVNLNFVKSPVGAAIAILSQFQNEVLNIENESLTTIANTIGSFYFKADITEAKISAVSNVVAAGTKFEGTMFIASSSSSASPTMSLDGRSIPVDAKGFGKIEFVATPAANYDDKGVAKKVLRGQIVTNVGGEDKVLPIEYEYFVAQPVIRTIRAMYLIIFIFILKPLESRSNN